MKNMKNMKDIKKQYGFIRISRELFMDELANLNVIFSVFYPTHIETNFALPYSVYHGYSPLFDEIKEGEKPHKYDIILNMDSNNIITLKEFKRIY